MVSPGCEPRIWLPLPPATTRGAKKPGPSGPGGEGIGRAGSAKKVGSRRWEKWLA
jgi:hypothetical protein